MAPEVGTALKLQCGLVGTYQLQPTEVPLVLTFHTWAVETRAMVWTPRRRNRSYSSKHFKSLYANETIIVKIIFQFLLPKSYEQDHAHSEQCEHADHHHNLDC